MKSTVFVYDKDLVVANPLWAADAWGRARAKTLQRDGKHGFAYEYVDPSGEKWVTFSVAKPGDAPPAADRGARVNCVTFTVPAGGQLTLRDIKLKPIGLTSVFNGKDLAGWKEVKNDRTKSVFTVTDKGELNIKDGPGDLQTEAEWDDFVLQLDVISNGKHLNSGVFYRCVPGQFWSGYEAQVRNQWEGEDRTKPVDFGTGGIYNRQKARKVVSSDNEYFTMTVIARGTHMATWVNGYQVTDFTDTKPIGNNARRGAKVGAGPISLQGHDPTTDLSFKNIRVAALPNQGRKD
jgi:hypothetical protein